jgi:hypothetical protein
MKAEQAVDEARLRSASHGLDPGPEWPFLNIRITEALDRGVIDWKPSVGWIKRFSFPWSHSRRLLQHLA